MEMKEESHGDLLIVQVCSSHIDASKAPEFKQEITSRIESGHTNLLLDFSMSNSPTAPAWALWWPA